MIVDAVVCRSDLDCGAGGRTSTCDKLKSVCFCPRSGHCPWQRSLQSLAIAIHARAVQGGVVTCVSGASTQTAPLACLRVREYRPIWILCKNRYRYTGATTVFKGQAQAYLGRTYQNLFHSHFPTHLLDIGGQDAFMAKNESWLGKYL